MERCAWCVGDEQYMMYHDNEWGVPVYEDRQLFAMLCLEGMQAGLSWITVLRKRERYHQLFYDFDADKIATMTAADVDRLMQETGIIRHRAKIEAIIHNAKLYQQITKQQSFSDYLWGIVRQHGDFPCDNRPQTLAEVPAKTAVSEALSKRLKKDGFKFVGATTCYAFMQAVGMVNDHVATCTFR